MITATDWRAVTKNSLQGVLRPRAVSVWARATRLRFARARRQAVDFTPVETPNRRGRPAAEGFKQR